MEKDQTLDPDNWHGMRLLGHKMVDDMVDFLSSIKEQPSWNPISEETKTTYTSSLPIHGQDVNEVYEEFKEHILPYYKGNIHPRFWSWVQGTGTMMGAYADFLSSVMNGNVAIGEHAAMYIDLQMISWCKEMMDWPKDGSGFLVSGGSMANFTALTVARNTMAGHIVRKNGLKKFEQQLVLYCSTETHSCVLKGAETLGIGSDFIKKIEVQSDFTVNIDLMRDEIRNDIQNGYKPFCIVANVGTVNTGAIDDIFALRNLANEYGIWLHIDGAFGSLSKLAPSHESILTYQSQADSIAFDLHKWMYMPYEIGVVLFKSAADHRATFSLNPSYLMSHERGLAAGPDPNNNFGLELSRGFKALKVWMSLKEHGIEKYAQLIQQNINHCQYLGTLVSERKELELCAPISLNVVCYRYVIEGWSVEQLNILNKEIVMTLQERGVASPSSTILHGNYCIRVAHVNHRSTKEDFDALVDATIKIGLEQSLNWKH